MNDDVEALQQEILRRMRAGACLRTAHKEGGTEVSFQRGVWTRSDYGESNATQTFRDERAFLAFLREHFRWEVSRDVAPAEVSELEAWKALLGRLEPGASAAHAGARGSAQLTGRGPTVWGIVVAAALVLLFTRARAELRGRELSPSIEALTLPAAVVLAVCVIVAAVWLRKHWK
jgi:succinate dehydrogenase/fumarate reductase flavoprotein subunit